MITNLWDNLRPADGSAPVVLTIGAAGGTGLLQQVIDMATVYNRGDKAAIELEVLTGVVAPGTPKNLTIDYAFCSDYNRDSVQLATAQAQKVCALQNTASVRRVYETALVDQTARYLHVWFECDALTAGAVLTLRLRVNAKTA